MDTGVSTGDFVKFFLMPMFVLGGIGAIIDHRIGVIGILLGLGIGVWFSKNTPQYSGSRVVETVNVDGRFVALNDKKELRKK